MAAAAFVAVEGIKTHELAQLYKVGNTACFIQLRIEFVYLSRYTHICPELFFQCLYLCYCFCKAFGITTHTTLIPHYFAKALMEAFHALLTLYVHHAVNTVFHVFFS